MKIFLFILIFVVPGISFASVSINEIMYDLEGTDTDREWIEIVNNGTDSVNLSNWKFYENNSNHGLVLVSGSEVLGPGSFAVIVDSPDTFLIDWPNFSGNLFDSSWSSFSNSGETFSIKNEDDELIDEVTYVTEDGAAGDGNSLQKINEEFLPASPTPGLENQSSVAEEELSNTEEESQTVSTEEETSTEEDTLGIPDRITAGEELKFKPMVYDSNGEPLFKALFEWSFGDGSTRKDLYRKDFGYTYKFPGTYVIYLEIYLNGKKDEPDYTYRQTIQVVSSSISLSLLPEGLSIKNKSVYELDLGDWYLTLDSKNFFVIPKNTILLPGKEITLSFDVLGQDKIEEVILKNEINTIIASINQKPAITVPEKIKTASTPKISAKQLVAAVIAREDEEAEAEPTTEVVPTQEDENKSSKNNIWFLVYGVLIVGVVGVVAYMYFRNEDEFIDEINEADEYTIE